MTKKKITLDDRIKDSLNGICKLWNVSSEYWGGGSFKDNQYRQGLRDALECFKCHKVIEKYSMIDGVLEFDYNGAHFQSREIHR